jgi:hypothetical protein
MRNTLRVCSAVLMILISSIVVTSSAQATVSASPSAIDFGSVNVNSLSSPTVIVMTNTGTEPVFVQRASSNLSQFILAGPALPLILQVNDSISLQVLYQPTAAGQLFGEVTFTMVRRSAGTLVVPVTGVGVQAQLSMSPSSFNFSSVTVGQTKTMTVTVNNPGTSSVTISQATASGAGFTAAGITLPLTLAAGASSTFSAKCTPSSAGSLAGTLRLVSNAPNSPLSAALTGTGTQAQLSVVPASVGFGSVAMGATNTQTVTLANSGNANLIITQATVSGSGFSASGIALPLSLVPGSSSTFTVSLDPNSAGNLAGVLHLTSNAPNSPVSAPLSGTGIAQVLRLSSNPTSLAFGGLALNTNASQTVTLTNSGNSALTISQLNMSGAGFSYSGILLPIALAAGQSTTFNAIFDPATSGNLSGSATVVSNATNSPMTIALSGSGAPPVVHSISLSWTASSSTVVGYNIYSATQSGGPYTKMNSSPSASLTYSDTNVVSGDTYFLVATSVDSSGVESANSNEATALVP